MTEKCPELQGLEKINPGSQVAKMVCEFKSAPAPQEIAKDALKKNDWSIGQAANAFENRRKQIEEAGG